jgi:hypothetical protein
MKWFLHRVFSTPPRLRYLASLYSLLYKGSEQQMSQRKSDALIAGVSGSEADWVAILDSSYDNARVLCRKWTFIWY